MPSHLWRTICSQFAGLASAGVFLGRRVPSRPRILLRLSHVRLRLVGLRRTRSWIPSVATLSSEALAESAPVGWAPLSGSAGWRCSSAPACRQCPLSYDALSLLPFLPLSRLPFPPAPAPRRPLFLVSTLASSGRGLGSWGGFLGLQLLGLRCASRHFVGVVSGLFSPLLGPNLAWLTLRRQHCTSV